MKFWFGKKELDEGSCEVLSISDQEAEVVTSAPPASVLIKAAQGAGAVGVGVVAKQPAPAIGPSISGVGLQQPVGGTVGAGPAKPAVGVSPQAAAKPIELTSGPGKPAAVAVGKGAAVSVQAPVNRLQQAGLSTASPLAGGNRSMPKPVMTPVRKAASTAPIKLSPVTAPEAKAEPATAVGPVAVGGGRPGLPAFGLRPKESGVVSVGPAAAPKPAAPLAGAPLAAQPAKPPTAGGAQADGKSVAVECGADGVVRPKTDQRALYYQLMNGLYDAVLILDDQGHIVDCNSRVTAMLGYSREDTWDIPIEKIITGMTSQMFEHLKRNLAENNHILIDARCFRQDGTSFAGEVGVSTLSLTRGSNIVFAIRNVDRRKHAMDEMRKGQSALEVALAPAFVCDLDGFFLVVNQAMLDAFGIPDEAQAKNVRFIDLLPDAARFFLRASCGEKIRESLRIPTPGGVPVKIELALKPVQNGQTVTAVAGSLLQV